MGSSLEDKFLSPVDLHDDGLPFSGPIPDLPGRPPSLTFSRGGPSSELTRLKKLDGDRERGELLHLFANHELLAIELMALCLLRFHDAPPSFRRQVLSTLADEQRHAKAYLERMKSCGVELGERPVNGTFWNHLKNMDSIESYCSGMALTLEQANLDFAHHFEKRFRQVGDITTADLLQEVYQDEIFHVRVGVQHLKGQLKKGEQLWDIWTQHLNPPLSPSRAKAYEMDIEGRRSAGLEDDFIDKLRRYERSKGRPPRVFLFNGLAENEILGGEASKMRLDMNKDFQTALHLLAHNDDIVVVDRAPSVTFLDDLNSAGFSRPEWCLRKDNPLELGHQKIASLHPWAWTPRSWQELKGWWPRQTQTDPSNWDPAQLLKHQGNHLSKSTLSFLPPSLYHTSPHEVFNLVELKTQLNQFPGTHLIKPALSSSGHGHLKVESDHEPSLGKIEKQLSRHGRLIIEPFHHRIADFSHPGHFDGEKIHWLGTTRMLIDAKGQYQGAWLGGVVDGLDNKTRKALHDQKGQPLWAQLHQNWEEHLVSHFRSIHYRGPFSIDAYLHRSNRDHQIAYRGCCELNLRSTFGHLSLALEKRLRKGCRGMMTFLPKQDWNALPTQENLQKTRSGEPGCWTRGIFPINDIWSSEKVSLLWVVSDSIENIQLLLKSINISESSNIHSRIDLIGSHK